MAVQLIINLSCLLIRQKNWRMILLMYWILYPSRISLGSVVLHSLYIHAPLRIKSMGLGGTIIGFTKLACILFKTGDLIKSFCSLYAALSGIRLNFNAKEAS